MTDITALGNWRRAFEKLDECPWPGPRPLKRHERELLIGREDETATLGGILDENRLVFLTGESGVGKSSFLNAGLIPHLEDVGYLPLVVDDWSRSETENLSIDAFVINGIERFPEGFDEIRKSPDEFWQNADERFGRAVVLILDQFEELIRYRRERFQEAIELVRSINENYSIRVVLSLRTEFEHRLRDLGNSVRPFTLYKYPLAPVTDPKWIGKLIRRPDAIASGAEGLSDVKAIESDAVTMLVKEWLRHHRDSRANLGLLNLQATLYSLYARSKRGTVTVEILEGMMTDAEPERQDAEPEREEENLFELGLREAAAQKMQFCVLACEFHGCLDAECEDERCDDPEHLKSSAGIDPYLVEGTRSVVLRAVPHLSSAGYKIPIEVWDLVSRSMARELGELGFSSQRSEEASKLYFNEFHRAGLSLLIPNPESEDAVMSDPRYPAFPHEKDLRSVSSGPMLGTDERSILREELRRAAFALEWLKTAKLIRSTTSRTDETMLSLIHDGFGSALEKWSAMEVRGPEPVLRQLTASRGMTYNWKRADGSHWSEFVGTESGHRTIANVRWTDCTISADFRRVVFVNCDFRGSLFEACRFEGVAFVNCVLDRATFTGCVFVGEASPWPTKESKKRAPSFKVKTTEDEIEWYQRYAGSRGTAKAMWFSDTSGFAAVPFAESILGGKPVLGWDDEPSGGMTMIGGRVSSLMLYRCETEKSGSIAFYHVQGSGLDIVEFEGSERHTTIGEGEKAANIKLFGAQLRGFAVTRDPDLVGSDGLVDDLSTGSKNILVRAVNSQFVNTTFGDELTGEAEFTNCVMWMLLSASDSTEFPVQLSNCQNWGTVNVDPGDSIDAEAISGDTFVNRPEAGRDIIAMSYHLRPEVWSRKNEPDAMAE